MTDRIPPVQPPENPDRLRLGRGKSPADAMRWLGAGWRDLSRNPGGSLLYGFLVFAVLGIAVSGIYAASLDFILFPALAAFTVVGPFLAIGLYEKSRRMAAGETVSIADMFAVRPRSGAQVLFVGVLLLVLALLWMRAAVLLYALFFGVQGFPGLDRIVEILFATSQGWALLGVGTLVGGLFAAFSFAVSVFAIPMLLDRRTDALTAMGSSVALVWHNLPVMLAWGAIVLVLTAIGFGTALIGLLVVFPLLGHATWHAWVAMRE